MKKCTRRNVGGRSQSSVHEWRLLREERKTKVVYDEKEGITYSGLVYDGSKRLFYCVWCRKVVEDEA